MKRTSNAVKKAETTELRIPAMDIRRIAMRVVGTSDLIVHAWDPKTETQMEEANTGRARNKKPPRDPNAEFEAAKYLDEKGRPALPAFFFKKCIEGAAPLTEGISITNVKKVVFIEGNMLPLRFKREYMRRDTVRVGSFGKKKATPRYRPAYADWGVDIVVQYNANIISAEELVNLFKIGGFSVGICEWRPTCGGSFGRFDVEPMIMPSSQASKRRTPLRAVK